LQFIFEAIVLSVIGGVVRLILIFIGTQIVSNATEFAIILTAGNIVTGLFISKIIGFIAGFMPARAAAKLNPVEAMISVRNYSYPKCTSASPLYTTGVWFNPII
jgi:putative ABC transport system permease protein